MFQTIVVVRCDRGGGRLIDKLFLLIMHARVREKKNTTLNSTDDDGGADVSAETVFMYKRAR